MLNGSSNREFACSEWQIGSSHFEYQKKCGTIVKQFLAKIHFYFNRLTKEIISENNDLNNNFLIN